MSCLKTPSSVCKICSAPTVIFETSVVLNKHTVQYFQCGSCGFMQTEDPFWLEEAYSSAIARQDVGIMSRNLIHCEVTAALLNLVFPEVETAVDYGGGHGVLVRLMRDKGFNFFWSDLHASNNFARGFEAGSGLKYDFLTAFEVLEHLVDPISDISKMMDLSPNVFVSTCLLPEPTPALSGWWYYMQSSGQHVSFYTSKSLECLANRFKRHLSSVGSFHLFSSKPVKYHRYRAATSPRLARLINKAYSRPSLIPDDLGRMTES